MRCLSFAVFVGVFVWRAFVDIERARLSLDVACVDCFESCFRCSFDVEMKFDDPLAGQPSSIQSAIKEISSAGTVFPPHGSGGYCEPSKGVWRAKATDQTRSGTAAFRRRVGGHTVTT